MGPSALRAYPVYTRVRENLRMRLVNQNNLIPERQSVFADIVAVQYLAVWVGFYSTLLCNCTVIHVQVLPHSIMLSPSSADIVRPLPSSAVNALPYKNITRLCPITKRTCLVQPCRMLN